MELILSKVSQIKSKPTGQIKENLIERESGVD